MTSGTSVDNLVCQYCKNGLIRKLNLSQSQVFISVSEAWDSAWSEPITVLIIPGAASQDGKGAGDQEGGLLFRRQQIKFVTFYRVHLDQYSASEIELTAATTGLLDFFEAVRGVFAYTYFGNADGTNCTLTDPMRWESESQTTWIDQALGIVRRDLVYSVLYSIYLPDITLTLAECQ